MPRKNNDKETVKTTFNCPIDLRDRLETLINEYIGQYTSEEIKFEFPFELFNIFLDSCD